MQRPFGRGPTTRSLGDLLTMVINNLLTGMVLQMEDTLTLHQQFLFRNFCLCGKGKSGAPSHGMWAKSLRGVGIPTVIFCMNLKVPFPNKSVKVSSYPLPFCWWFRNPVNSPVEGQVDCPIIHRVLAPSQVVVWDFIHQQLDQGYKRPIVFS